MKKYVVTGYYYRDNKAFSKGFRTLNKANRYLDSMLDKIGCLVDDSYTVDNTVNYICDDNARFVIEER